MRHDIIKIISPVDGSVYAERPLATDAEIDAAVSARPRGAGGVGARAGRRARQGWSIALLDALLAMNDEIVPELAWQMGRPVRYGGEKRGLEERARYMAAIAEEALAPLVPKEKAGFRRYMKREPLGIVLVIAPWNYPYPHRRQLDLPGADGRQRGDPEARGADAARRRALPGGGDKAGLPKGLFQNLVLGHEQTEQLIASGKIDHINFTGSVAGGKAIERAAAGTFASLGLELGGKDPAYVLPDAKLDHAIENLVDGAFFNSGQCCCGIERIYVHEKVYEPFVEGFVDLTKKYVVGNPLDAGDDDRADGARELRRSRARADRRGAPQGREGAHRDEGHEVDRRGSPYLAPEVLTNVNHQMAVMREESSGRSSAS